MYMDLDMHRDVWNHGHGHGYVHAAEAGEAAAHPRQGKCQVLRKALFFDFNNLPSPHVSICQHKFTKVPWYFTFFQILTPPPPPPSKVMK